MCLLLPWEFSPAREKFTVKKMHLCHQSLSFHQISCRRRVGGWACAGGEVIKHWVWGNVQHSQTTLMPCVVICQNELWSRILLITLQGKMSLLLHVSACFALSLSHLSSTLSIADWIRFKRWNQGGNYWVSLQSYLPLTTDSFPIKQFHNNLNQYIIFLSFIIFPFPLSVAPLSHGVFKYFSMKCVEFPLRQKAPSQLQGFDKSLARWCSNLSSSLIFF